MDFDKLNTIVDRVNAKCKAIDEETKKYKEIQEVKDKELFSQFVKDLVPYIDIVKKISENKYISIPTSMKDSVGDKVFLRLGKRVNFTFQTYHREPFSESWDVASLDRGDIVRWWFKDLDHDEFDMEFERQITKELRKKMSETTKRYDEAKGEEK